jgi:hypothetical protein
MGTAAAIRYEAPDDPAAARLHALLEAEGLDAVLSRICGVSPDSEIARLVRAAFAAPAG